MRNVLRTVAVTIALGCCVGAFAQRAYVIDRNGNRKDCTDVKADSKGDLNITIGATTLQLKRDQYRYVVTPKPEEVTKLERFSEQQNHQVVISAAGKLYDKYKYLGWGGYIASIEAMSKLAQDDAAGALASIQKASSSQIVGAQGDAVNKAKISALIALGRGDEAAPILQKLKASKDEDLAAFAFLADGQILEKQGRKQEALLAYLKTILLFKDGAVESEQREARKRAAAILEANGDPRASQFK